MDTVRQNFNVSAITNSVIRITLRLLLSLRKQEQIDELTNRFNRFKQQFDRGISVQTVAGTLEMLLEQMGTALHPCSKVNH
jgi:hypothetical protein